MSPQTLSQTGVLVVGREDAPEPARSLPLTGVEVHARITGPVSRVRLVQHYRNDAATPVEATYVFPMEEASAVCGFRARIDGALLEGRVEARDEAFDAYDDALAEGRTAFLLDQERPDVFTASVGNLLPGQELAIELEYVAEVPREGDALRWRLPTTVSPRYVPTSRRDAEGMDDAERLNPPASADPLPYRLRLRVEADLGTALRSVESPSHKIRVELEGERATVELAGDEGLMDRDFVLLLRPQNAVAPVAGIEEGPDGKRYVGVSFLPAFGGARAPVEVVFVVDCSGSMQGGSIEEARKTLRLCLRALEPGDRFNLIRFGSRHERYAKASVAYDDDTLARADAYVARMEANLGGTEILDPLADAYALPLVEGTPRRIVLITDGQVSNEDAVLELARGHAAKASVFAFGVGHGASAHLVQGLARAGRGAAEMVVPGERIDDKVLRHFHRLTARAASDARLTWEGLTVEDVLPHRMPPVWAGDPVSFYGRVTEGRAGRAVLAVTLDGEERRFIAEPRGAAEGADGATPLLWARRRIRALEEGPDAEPGGSQRPDRVRERLQRRKEAVEAELVELGRTFGLVSSATSYVLVDTREAAQRATTRARFVRVPGQLTRGWHGAAGVFLAGAASLRASAQMGDRRCETLLGLDPALQQAQVPDQAWRTKCRRPRREVESPVREAAVDPRDTLALLLTADGFWPSSPETQHFTGLSATDIREIAEGLDLPQAETLVVTLAVLVKLEARGAPAPDAWKPLLAKARGWVARTVGEAAPPHETDWESWMRSRLRL